MLTDILTALRDDPDLARADVILLSEVDLGWGGSGTTATSPGELGQGLGMHYAFGVSYLVLGDDVMENAGHRNTLALAGSAVLSRWPIRTWTCRAARQVFIEE